MKKILPILIALILCLSAAAAAEGKGAFRFDEAYDYAMALLEAAQNAGDARKATLEDGLTRLEAGGAVFVYEEGEGYLDLKSATLLNGTEDARGFASGFFGWESVSGVSTAEVLAAYPNGNSRLEGTFDAALIYLERDGGDVLYGLCSRDGQRILSLEYGFDGAKGTALVRYSFLDDSLEDITYYFGDAAQSQAAGIGALEALKDEKDYFAYYTGAEGEETEVFAREDLFFAGMDVMTLTRGDLEKVFGAPDALSETGGQVQLMWDGLAVTFPAADGTMAGPAALLVSGGDREGPRGLRVGDTLGSVLRRFRNDAGRESDRGTLLYGDGENAPYGLITFGADTATVTYCALTDEGSIFLYCNFEDYTLVNYLIAR
ncbi:MAG: hypothetical protein IJR97_01495 [Clostridia bacterium]|nr:hypothetical protein [Clostridia bacterium]